MIELVGVIFLDEKIFGFSLVCFFMEKVCVVFGNFGCSFCWFVEFLLLVIIILMFLMVISFD